MVLPSITSLAVIPLGRCEAVTKNCRVYFLLAGDTWDLYGCLEMFHNFMYFAGCCRAALAEVNYGLLCDLIETEEEEGEKAEEEQGGESNRGVFPLIHSSEVAEQVAPASFVRPFWQDFITWFCWRWWIVNLSVCKLSSPSATVMKSLIFASGCFICCRLSQNHVLVTSSDRIFFYKLWWLNVMLQAVVEMRCFGGGSDRFTG